MLSHIAIIMDGNSRWAEARGLSRLDGHRQGAEALRNTIKGCIESDISYLTVYAFSSENWNRPKYEIQGLMQLLRFYLSREINELNKNKVRISFIGDRSKLEKDILEQMQQAETITKNNNKLHLHIALSYGSRQEIIEAAKNFAEDYKSGRKGNLDEKLFAGYLHTAGTPDPDLLIRTGGDQRLSNFLLWQSAYTEFYFTPVLWPDFGHKDLKKAISEFQKRERRYGRRDLEQAAG